MGGLAPAVKIIEINVPVYVDNGGEGEGGFAAYGGGEDKTSTL